MTSDEVMERIESKEREKEEIEAEESKKKRRTIETKMCKRRRKKNEGNRIGENEKGKGKMKGGTETTKRRTTDEEKRE